MEFFTDQIKNRDGKNPEHCRNCTQNKLTLAENEHEMFDPMKQRGMKIHRTADFPDFKKAGFRPVIGCCFVKPERVKTQIIKS